MVPADFEQITWDEQLEQDLSLLVDLALKEDLGDWHDWTTEALIPPDAPGQAAIILQSPGVLAGLPAVQFILARTDPQLAVKLLVEDGDFVPTPGPVAEITGPARKILCVERIILNILGRLSGIATLTRQFVKAVEGTGARIFDTRKTTPGWRRLEKYAVRCGGGWNHRCGLHEGILIKDNHLSFLAERYPGLSPGQLAAEAVRKALRYREALAPQGRYLLVEVEVESLQDFELVLEAGPDLVLLDNMSPRELRQAVEVRNRLNPKVELEASGGITLETVRQIAETGVERISVGALTHSAKALDFSLEWILRTPKDRLANS